MCLFQEGTRGGTSSVSSSSSSPSASDDSYRRSPVDLCVMVFRSTNRSGSGPLVGKHVGHSKRQVQKKSLLHRLRVTTFTCFIGGWLGISLLFFLSRISFSIVLGFQHRPLSVTLTAFDKKITLVEDCVFRYPLSCPL